MEGFVLEPKAKESLEGKIVTARTIKAYARSLHFNPHILENQRILNFGSGGSNIGEQLRRMGIVCDVTDADRELVGIGKKSAKIKIAENFVGPESWVGKKLNKLQNQHRPNFVRADGKALPFKDKSFNTVFALWSTYQIPDIDKTQVFGELMRVGNVVHCGPITSKDFDVINNLCQKKGFDIIACRPFKESGVFTAHNNNDYRIYKDKFPYQERVRAPEIDSPGAIRIFDRPILAWVSSGNYIILQRRPQ